MLYQSLAVLTASLATANAHMIMSYPVPFDVGKLDNAPITAEQFPCKSNLGFTVSQMNTMAVGQQQMIKWNGTAVHGGGGCQLSVTLDTTPTKSSVYKVIKSFEGSACPQASPGAGLPFKLPDSIPSGKATFVWTWFSSTSGAPELYMNCAPIEVTGGASDKSKFDALPDMFVANIASTTCKTPQPGFVKFPNPGTDLDVSVDASKITPPTGACGASGPSGNTTTPAQPSGQPSAPSAQPSAGNNGQYTPPASVPASQPSAPAATPTAPAGEPQPTGKPVATSTAAGGVFAPGASGAAGTSTTLVTVTAPSQPQATEPSPAAPTTPAAPAPAMPSGTGTTSPSSGTGSGTCTTNGALVCNGEKQFGLCNNGNVIWQDVAAGTTCVNGVISKRSFNGRIARPRL